MGNRAILTARIFVLLLIAFSFCGLSLAAGDSNWEDKTFYLGHNVWFEQPIKIPTTNYHKGMILKVGSQATITRVTDRTADFSVEGATYRLVYVRNHHANVSIADVIKRTFLSENPLKSSKYRSFSKSEKANIKDGTIEKGMSKDAVIMAYGYPPDHRTPSINNNIWTYWMHRFKTTVLRFDRSGKLIDLR